MATVDPLFNGIISDFDSVVVDDDDDDDDDGDKACNENDVAVN